MQITAHPTAGWNTLPIPLVQESGSAQSQNLQEWFRCRFQHQALSILRFLKSRNYITYSLLGKTAWSNSKYQTGPKTIPYWNTTIPVKDTGFFFFPIAKVHELIGIGKCSEMDVILDLWIHAVYNDSSVLGSDSGPIVYYRDNTGNPLPALMNWVKGGVCQRHRYHDS